MIGGFGLNSETLRCMHAECLSNLSSSGFTCSMLVMQGDLAAVVYILQRLFRIPLTYPSHLVGMTASLSVWSGSWYKLS